MPRSTPWNGWRAFGKCCGPGLPCVVVTAGLPIDPVLAEIADARGVPVLSTDVLTSETLVALTGVLEEGLAPMTTLHGVLVDILGLGVLLLGESGIGKSECALDLVVRGHRLVADDAVEITRRGLAAERYLTARSRGTTWKCAGSGS